MNFSLMKAIFAKILFVAWVILATLVFLLYSGRTSFIYGSSLENWIDIPGKLTEIHIFFFLQNLLVALAGISIFVIACASLGSILITSYYSEPVTSWMQWFGTLTTAFLVGEILFSIVFLILGMIGHLTPLTSGLTLALGGALGSIPFGKFMLSHRNLNRQQTQEMGSRSDAWILWLSIAILGLGLLLTSARLSYDSVALYFSNAKLAAMTHHLEFFLHDSFVVSSFHAGVLYTGLIQLFGDQAARSLSWLSGVGIVILSLALAEFTGVARKGKLITIALLATSTAFVDLLGDGKIELTSTLPAIAAIYWLFRAQQTDKHMDYLLVGLFTGFAIILRPYNLVLLGGFVGLFSLLNDSSLSTRFRSWSLIAAPIFILIFFHLFANWVILGDPLAPLHNTLKVQVDIWQWSFVKKEDIWIFRILFPFVATFLNTPQSLGNISPILLLLLPLFLMRKVRTKILLPASLKRMAAIALAVLIVWIWMYFTVLEIRYVFFLWIIIYLASADFITTSLENLGSTGRKSLEGLIIVLLLFILARNVFIAVDAYAPLDQNHVAQCGGFIFCDYLAPVNRLAQPGERVLTLNAYRYYLRPELFACSTKNVEYTAIREASLNSADAFWREVYRQGYTYITYEQNYAVRHLYMTFLPSPANAPTWVKLEKLSEAANGYFISYKIDYVGPPIHIEKACSQLNGVWLVQDENP